MYMAAPLQWSNYHPTYTVPLNLKATTNQPTTNHLKLPTNLIYRLSLSLPLTPKPSPSPLSIPHRHHPRIRFAFPWLFSTPRILLPAYPKSRPRVDNQTYLPLPI